MKTNPMLFFSAAMICIAAPAFAQGVAPAERHVYFGELHLHTTISLDAWSIGAKVVPDQALKFGRGETVMVPAAQVGRMEGIPGGQDVPAKRAWPLDFMAVTDHSELMGTLHQLDDPNSAFAQTDFGKELIKAPVTGYARVVMAWRRGGKAAVKPEWHSDEAVRNSWEIEKKAANDNYEPGKFTTFIAYEWSAVKEGRTMHRNVFFNSSNPPLPFTSLDSIRPEDLWTYLESVRKQGIDVIAIPHNSNLSGGFDFDWNDSDGRPIDEAYAQRRILNEPLVEIAQTKGSSDTAPDISPNDEFARFELYEKILPGQNAPKELHGGYVRDALGRGLVIEAKVGVNPFKLGIEGSSDIHNGLSASEENAFAGGAAGLDPNTMLPRGEAAKRILGQAPMGEVVPSMDAPGGGRGGARGNQGEGIVEFSSPGLTGVWAEENNRDSIFAALKRKETFGTSGERIRVRAFAGWNYDSKMMASPDWVGKAYGGGAAMGGDIPARPPGVGAPKFALWAMKDPDGANLDRIQVIKLWLDGGDYKEKIFNVALSDGRKADARTGRAPDVGNTVDVNTATYSNKIGATELSTVWQDPEFDAAKPAVYYVRVLQIPTPRWTTYLAAKNRLPLPKTVPATLQERAWSSPLWYTPMKS